MKHFSIFILIALVSCSMPGDEARWSSGKGGILFFRGKDRIGLLAKYDEPGIVSKDEITELDSGIFLVNRIYENVTDSAVHTHLFLDFIRDELPKYFMIPAVYYNGNEWDGRGESLTYSYRRTSIPAMTYSEGKDVAVSLWCDSVDFSNGVSCAFIEAGDHCIHRLIVPEEEWPLSYNDRKKYGKGWKHSLIIQPHETYRLSAILSVDNLQEDRRSLSKSLSFAWNRYEKVAVDAIDPAQLWALSCRFAKESLWVHTREFEGFSIGLWNENGVWVQQPVLHYEIGWSGQNASLANSLLKNYIFYGDSVSLTKGIKALDTWASYATLDNGLFITRFDDILLKQTNHTKIDANNLSAVAAQYMEASELAEVCGISRPLYSQIGLNVCKFILGSQEPSGRYGELWNISGECIRRDGTAGASLISAMIKAFRMNGQNAYFESAVKAYDFYIAGFIHDGFTTAGALDAKCIDKESAVPLLRSSILLYEITQNKEYLHNAENLSWYLSTWLWHYSDQFPANSDMNRYQYDTFASTSVSTLYHYLTPSGLSFVPDWIRLAGYTGNQIWKEKAMAVWHNANQLVSDGELVMHGLRRPAGSQSEAYFQTYWKDFGSIDDCLMAWPCAFRLEVLRSLDDWSVLN